ncbi:MAG: serine/threonine protein kinase, partial [Myxococcales bacterium]|nr:serine/threonine protein kinase [Myxococcales bacterium]
MQPEPETQVLPANRKGRDERAAESSSSEALVLQRWVGRYELIHRLAHGGMATVYLGRAKGKAGFEKVVAVKVIHPHLADEVEFVSMFLDEARIAARILHPHVVQILDLGEADGVYHMVMEFIEGDNLAALVRAMAGERLPISVILQLLADTLEGLGAAHDLRDSDGRSYGVVHRDVSPHNILINLDGWAKVGDFGVMKAAGKNSNTKTGELRGKLAYMSPEQARGGAVDARTDIFATGVIAWELLAGRRLFACETESATLEKVVACEVPALDYGPEGERPELDRQRWPKRGELADGLDALLRRALAPKAEDRFADAGQMLTEVKRLIRLCNATLGEEDECPEPRAHLGTLMNRFFRSRVDYARAALRRTGEHDVLPSQSARARALAVEATVRVPTGSNPTLTDAFVEQPTRAGGEQPTRAGGDRPTRAGGDQPTKAELDGNVVKLVETRQTASHATVDEPVSIHRKPVAGSGPSQWLLWLFLPMFGAIVAVVVLLSLGLLGQPARVDPAVDPSPVAEPTTPESASTEVQWFFFTNPPGAEVYIDGERWDELTPTQVSYPRGNDAVDIVLVLEGYQSKSRQLVPLSNENFNEVLSP